MGRSAEERAVIESWLRRIERDGIYAAQEAFRNATPGLKGRALPGPLSLEQIPALAVALLRRKDAFLSASSHRNVNPGNIAGAPRNRSSSGARRASASDPYHPQGLARERHRQDHSGSREVIFD